MHIAQAYSQPSDKGGRFPQILDLFQGLKIGVAVYGETSIFLNNALGG